MLVTFPETATRLACVHRSICLGFDRWIRHGLSTLTTFISSGLVGAEGVHFSGGWAFICECPNSDSSFLATDLLALPAPFRNHCAVVTTWQAALHVHLSNRDNCSARRGARCATEPKSVCLSREIFLFYFCLLPPPSLFLSPLHVIHRCHIDSASDHWSLGPWFTKCSRRMVGEEEEVEEELSVSLGNRCMGFFASPYLLEACISPGSRQVESIAPVLICNSGHVLSSGQQIADHDICTERCN